METIESACYLLYETEPTDDPQALDSWSIVITGQLADIPEDGRKRFDTAEINRHFAPIRVFDEAIEDVEIKIVELESESVTGRVTTA